MNEKKIPEFVAVLDRNRETIGWVKRRVAKRLLAKGKVVGLGSRQKIRALQLAQEYDDARPTTIGDYTGQSYSHNNAVSETYVGDDGRLKRRPPIAANPEGVWTLRHLPDHTGPIFDAVWLSCLKKAA